MKNKYSLILFDLDGTLLDTSEGVILSYQYVLTKNGFKTPAPDEISSLIGPPFTTILRDRYGVDDEEKCLDLNTQMRDFYKKENLYKAKVYDGISELLKKLSDCGKKIAVATYKREDMAEDVVRHFGLLDYFDCVCGSDKNNTLSKSDIISNCMKRLGFDEPQKVLMIGDSDNDAVAASGAGTDFLAVLYGFGFRNKSDIEKFNCKFVCNTVDEIGNIILS